MSIDTLGFLEAVRSLPEQFSAGIAAGQFVDLAGLEGAGPAIRGVVVCGMGGSGISGDVLRAVAAPVAPVPIVVLKGYDLPAFVGPGSLVFAVSYSGGTEETLAAAEAAFAAGARVVAVCGGGRLAQLASDHGAPIIPCPSGFMPRAALGHLSAPLFVALERLGLLPGATGWVVAAGERAAERREACRPEIEGAANPARELARRIGRTIPLVWGGGDLGAVAAQRWKADVNENAKAPAIWNTFPELDHNEICGFGQHGDVTRQVLTLVELRHDFEHPRVARRVGATRAIVEETVGRVLEVRAGGSGPLAQLVDLMYVGDWVSVYLAFDAGVDPGPIEAIAVLKDELGRAGR